MELPNGYAPGDEPYDESGPAPAIVVRKKLWAADIAARESEAALVSYLHNEGVEIYASSLHSAGNPEGRRERLATRKSFLGGQVAEVLLLRLDEKRLRSDLLSRSEEEQEQ